MFDSPQFQHVKPQHLSPGSPRKVFDLLFSLKNIFKGFWSSIFVEKNIFNVQTFEQGSRCKDWKPGGLHRQVWSQHFRHQVFGRAEKRRQQQQQQQQQRGRETRRNRGLFEEAGQQGISEGIKHWEKEKFDSMKIISSIWSLVQSWKNIHSVPPSPRVWTFST